MLQAIVADDDVAAGGDQRLRGGDAIAVHAHLGVGRAGDQQGLVADQRRIAVGIDPTWHGFVLAAVPAAGDTGRPAFRAQARDQGDHQRGLASAAGGDVAHHDHWRARLQAA